MTAPIRPKVELFYGGQWNSETGRVFGPFRDQLRITRGVANEGGKSAPTSMRFSMDNSDGRFSIKHPLSPLFGLAGRNMPVRAYLGTPHPAAANFDLTDTTDHVAPSVDAPTDDGLLLCAWAAPGSATDIGLYTPPPSMIETVKIGGPAGGEIGGGQLLVARESIAAAGATGTRTATVTTAEDYVAASVLLHGPAPAFVDRDTATQSDPVMELTGLNVGDWLVCFAYHGFFGIVNPGQGEQLQTLPEYPVDLVEGGWILMADTGVLFVGDSDADLIRLRAWARRVRRPGTHTVRVEPLGRTLMATIALSGVDNWDLRGHAEIASMPPRRDTSGNDRWVEVDAGGIMRRLGAAAAEELDSAYTRAAVQRVATAEELVIGHWPMEDLGPDTSRLESSLPGGKVASFRPQAVTVGPVRRELRWSSSDDLLPGSGSLPRIESLFGQITVSGEVAAAFPDAVGMCFWTRGSIMDDDNHDTFTQAIMRLWMTGTAFAQWELICETRSPDSAVPNGLTNLVLTAYDGLGNPIGGAEALVQLDFDPRWLHAAVVLDATSATEVDAEILLNGEVVGTLSVSGAPLGRPVSFRFEGFSSSLNFVAVPTAAAVSIGHPTVLGSTLVEGEVIIREAVQDLHTAGRGHVGEPAGRRLLRLCQEEGIAHSVVGDPDLTVMMGPQRPATLLQLLRECETADRGLLYEPREFLGLAYRTVGSLYDQPPVATVNFPDGEMAQWQPQPDDLLIRNDVTATRPDGGSARSVQTTGPLNVGDPAASADAAGRYRFETRPNVAADALLLHQASWVRHLGTVDEPRFPRLAVNLLREQELSGNPALVDALAGLDIGDRAAITDPPDDVPPDEISQLWVGSAEVLTQVDRGLVGNTVPESPYHIADSDAALLGVADNASVGQSDSATLAEDLDTTETAVDIVAGAGPDCDHEVDFDIVIGGERMTVTAVGAMAGTFPDRTCTLTVVRSVNGVVKSHTSGDRVEWFDKRYIGL